MKTSQALASVLSIAFLAASLLVGQAHAQQFDTAFGVSALGSPASNLTVAGRQAMGGGAYPSVSANFLFWHNAGVQGEVAWRGSQNLYQGFQPYRTIFYDFNGIWAPPIGPRAQAEFLAGIGASSNRFYTQFVNCSFTGCTNYVSSTHFMGHFGGGIRLYLTDRLFIRPEAHVYLIHNNVEFADSYAYRYGASVGYTFGERSGIKEHRRWP